MESNTYILLGILAVILHLQGWIYALQILNTPTEPGWTWASVATGTLMIAVGETSSIFILYATNSLTLIPTVFVPISVLILLGSPMAILQIFKKLRADHNAKRIEKEQNFSV